jgi:hypothetical protein
LRALLLLLLFANIAFFAWSHWIAAPLVTGLSPLPAAAQLVLAREAQPGPKAGPMADEEESPVSCVSIGPFLDLTEAARASTRLRELGYGPRQRVTEGPVWSGWWVALERIEGREAAEDVVARLRQFGVTDAYIMPGEEAGVTVSLGLFSEQPRALRRLDEVKALGYEPVVTERQRTGTVYWIDADLPAPGQFPDPASFEGEQGRITRLEMQPCEADGRASQPVEPVMVPAGVPG